MLVLAKGGTFRVHNSELGLRSPQQGRLFSPGGIANTAQRDNCMIFACNSPLSMIDWPANQLLAHFSSPLSFNRKDEPVDPWALELSGDHWTTGFYDRQFARMHSNFPPKET